MFARRKVKLTSTIPTNSINEFILAHLEHSLVTRLAAPIMRTMPSSADTVSNLPLLLAIADCGYLSNDFMSRDARVDIAEMALLHKAV